ncbi:MAG: hypothetical protein LBH00_12105 [Planctomycetaceae bacterium]|jgi:hypothetical protein|nr:hypothetical protein [Planctomycetaceae bacterium]
MLYTGETMQRREFLMLLPFAASAGCRYAAENPDAGEPAVSVQKKTDTVSKPDEWLLRYRFRKGEELRWNVLQTIKMRNIIGGVEENIETHSRSVKIWKTLDVNAGGTAVFEYRVEDVDMYQVQTGFDDAAYNSRRDKTIPAAFINLDGKIGVPLARISIDPLGKTAKKPMREYAGHITENRIVIPLPAEPVKTGAEWTVSVPAELPLPNRTVKKVKARQRFTLSRVHHGLTVIPFETLVYTPLTPKEESQLFDLFAKGTMELDLDAGHFIRQQMTIDRLAVGVSGNADSISYQSRLTECCCGKKACEICTPSA